MRNRLKANLGLGREDCQHAVIDEFLCMVTGCALETDLCHWMFFKVNMVYVSKIPHKGKLIRLLLCEPSKKDTCKKMHAQLVCVF